MHLLLVSVSLGLLGAGLLGLPIFWERKNKNGSPRWNRYKAIYAGIWDPIVIAGTDRTIVDCNPAFEKVFGYSLQEIKGQNAAFLYANPEDYEQMGRRLADHQSTGKQHMRIPLKTKQGRIITFDLSAFPLLDEVDNSTVGFIGVLRDVSEELAYEEKILEEKKLLELVTESNPVGIVFLDKSGQITYANKPAEQILGISKQTITQRLYNDPLWRITDPEGRPMPDEQLPFRRVIETGMPVYEASHGVEGPDGEWKLLSINSAPITQNGNGIVGVVATLTDITEQHKTRKDLSEKNDQLQVAYEAAELGTWRHDMVANIISFNENGLKHYGFDASGVTLEEVFSRVHKDDLSRLQEEFLQTTAAESTGEFATQYRVHHEDGSVRWLQVHVRVKFEGEGKHRRPVLGFGTSQDITGQKETELELKKLYKGVEQSPALVLITDHNANIEYVNPQFLKTTGYSRHEVIGKNPRILKSGLTVPEEYQQMWATITKGKVWQGEFINRKKNGDSYIFSTSIAPITDEQKTITHYIAVGEDITRRRKNEQRIQDALAEKTVLLSEVHHRVKNNLAVISGLMELQTMTSPGLQEILQLSQNRIKTIAQVHELLYQSERFAEVDLEAYINTLAQMVESTFKTDKRKITIELDLSRIKLNVNLAVPFGLMINELITNSYTHAFKNKTGGIITIALQEKDESLYFCYTDNGKGLPDVKSIADFNKYDSLGFELIWLLSDQLGAFDKVFKGDRGFLYSFHFNKAAENARGSSANYHV